ncbi:SGNH hydrolase [Pseudovirgaria hyperparasitica]|uniref:SGNH hydrolase n=1 Tax=Pseudovirgaria hyperparasitica TaxID=470096 RepID=A0A6A6VWI7_9PEZI|nr:SGNH hydrolase [Pseudovirgaria hyperparasitica]KAF2753617.1 SGNH hydrolase [Pseudovirgaria hyperparasitica]
MKLAIVATLSALCASFTDALVLRQTPGQRLPSGNSIRLLPLGDSITWGTDSTDESGYRGGLLSELSGNIVDFIGNASQRRGNIPDPDNAGWPGYTIAQIGEAADNASTSVFAPQPNVVTLHAGTNDMIYIFQDYAGAPDRLEALINKITANVPNTLVLVAKIIHASDPDVDARIQTYNSGIDAAVQRAQQGGKFKVRVVDQSAIDDLGDGVHPTDAGYATMATNWYNAIYDADVAGLISPA